MWNAGLAAAGVFVWLLAAADLGLNMSLAADVSFEIMTDKDAPGNDYKRINRVSLETCEARCLEESKCAAFTYNQRRRICFLKDRTDPELADFRGATTGLKRVLQDADRAPSEPEPDSPSPVSEDEAASPQLDLPDEPVISLEPKTQTAGAAEGCTLFDGDFALTRNPNIILKFDQLQGNAVEADKARMSFYDQGSKVLSGRLRLEANQFRFIEDSDASVSRGVTILDRNSPSGNSISDPVFVVVGGLPFDGGVFRRAKCQTP